MPRAVRYVVVTGTIGAGATTLARQLATAGGWTLLAEADPALANPFFGRMYADIARWGFASQVAFLTASAQRHRRLRELLEAGASPVGHLAVVEDRTPFEHRLVYLAVQAQLGLLPGDELALLTDLAGVLESGFLVPDVLVHRRVERAAADRRIATRARPGEERMQRRWLEAVDAAFEDLARDWTACPVTVVGPDVDARDDGAVRDLLARL